MKFKPPTQLSRTLDAEFKRVAQQERITMEELSEVIAELVGRDVRQVYNWRSGKWPLPSDLIPILSRRFKSFALVNTLLVECSDVKIEIPEGADIVLQVSARTRKTLRAYEHYLKAFEDGGIDSIEMPQVREALEGVIRGAYEFLEIAVADCDRRREARSSADPNDPPSDQSKRSPKNPSDHVLTHGGGRS